MATNGRGVSWTAKGGDRWLVRWRQPGDENPTDKTFTGSEAALLVRVAEVERAKAERRRFDWPAEARKEAPAANLKAGIEAYIAAKRTKGKLSAKTANTYTSYLRRIMDHVWAILRVPENTDVPVTVLTRDLFDRIAARDVAAGASSMMSYAPPLLLLKAWQWMAGEPARWNRIPAAPQGTATEDYLPRTPKYRRTKAPTMAHLDACIRHLPTKATQSTRIAAIVMRYTGLRAAEVFGLRYEDFDVEAKLLTVSSGTKTDAADRVIPLVDRLLAEPGVRGWFSLGTSGPAFPKRRHTATKDKATKGRKVASETFKAAWAAATEAGEAPRHVWAPEGRKYTRPEHAFRAALDAHLRDHDVAPDVIDYIVGHEGDLSATHYGRDLDAKCRAALSTVPAIDWNGPQGIDENVVVDLAARR